MSFIVERKHANYSAIPDSDIVEVNDELLEEPISRVLGCCPTCCPKLVSYEIKKDGKKGSLINYDPKFLITIGWMMPTEASVFTIFEACALIIFFSALCTLLAFLSCDNLKRDSYCIYFPAPSTTYLTLMTLCAFVLAYFVNIIITRWWNLRTHLEAVMGATKDMLVLLMAAYSSLVRLSPTTTQHSKSMSSLTTTQHSKSISMRVMGLSLLAIKLFINKNRPLQAKQSIARLVEKNMISSQEAEFFSLSKSAENGVLCLLMTIIHDEGKAGNLGNLTGQISNYVPQIRNNMGLAQMYIDVDLPYPFVQIVAAVVWCFLIQLIYVSSSFISSGISTSDKGSIGTGYITIVLYSFALIGLLKLFTILDNPLGDDAADFPCDSYVCKLESELEAIRVSSIELSTSVEGIFTNHISSRYYSDDDDESMAFISNKSSFSKRCSNNSSKIPLPATQHPVNRSSKQMQTSSKGSTSPNNKYNSSNNNNTFSQPKTISSLSNTVEPRSLYNTSEYDMISAPAEANNMNVESSTSSACISDMSSTLSMAL